MLAMARASRRPWWLRARPRTPSSSVRAPILKWSARRSRSGEDHRRFRGSGARRFERRSPAQRWSSSARFPSRTGTDANVQIRDRHPELDVRPLVKIVRGRFFNPGLAELVVGKTLRRSTPGSSSVPTSKSAARDGPWWSHGLRGQCLRLRAVVRRQRLQPDLQATRAYLQFPDGRRYRLDLFTTSRTGSRPIRGSRFRWSGRRRTTPTNPRW